MLGTVSPFSNIDCPWHRQSPPPISPVHNMPCAFKGKLSNRGINVHVAVQGQRSAKPISTVNAVGYKVACMRTWRQTRSTSLSSYRMVCLRVAAE